MPDLAERRTTPRLQYDSQVPARLYLNGEICPVLDLARGGLRYELPALPVRPATSAIFEGELRLACGELVPVLGRVVRTAGRVAAARIDPTPLSDLQWARERDYLRQGVELPPGPDLVERFSERRRWRSRSAAHPPHEPRRSEA